MEEKKIGTSGKPLFIAEEHHHVLKAWQRFSGHAVLTFDKHNDSLPAFNRNAGVKHNAIFHERMGIFPLEENIALLRNDEHLDYATRSGMVSRVYACSLEMSYNYQINDNAFAVWHYEDIQERKRKFANPSSLSVWEQGMLPKVTTDDDNYSADGRGIIEYEITCQCPGGPHTDECLVLVADAVLEDDTLNRALDVFFQFGFSIDDPFILDFDMDFFRTENALRPKNIETLTKLATKAAAITIAKEDHHCEDEWLDNRPISTSGNLKALLHLLNFRCRI